MSYEEYLHTTPPEINIKIAAYNDKLRWDKKRDYNLAVLLLNGRNEPANRFPTFARFYPEIDPETQQVKVDRQVSQAMETARQMGDL